MIYNKIGQVFCDKSRKFIIGEEIIGTDQSEYKNLIGYIVEIRTDSDRETENETPDIYCSFEPPTSAYDIEELEAVFSDLYDEPKKMDDIILDMVIMSPEMIVPTREQNLFEQHVTDYTTHQNSTLDNEKDTADNVVLGYDNPIF